MGITRYNTVQWQSENSLENGVALISDDTQMTLYTACGILNAKKNGTAVIPTICEVYIEWLIISGHPETLVSIPLWIL